MSRLYSEIATREEVLTTNGLYNLSEITLSSRITEEFNGEFSLEETYAISKNVFNEEVYNNIQEEKIIKVDDEYGEEVFRIAKVRKDKTSIYIYARQITIADQLTLYLNDVRPENTNGQGALSRLMANAVGRNKDFFLTSDLSNTSTAYYIDMSLYDALFKADNAFVSRWGGETIRRQYNCKINQRIGEDRGVVIKSKKNLIGFEINSNLDELTTRIIPKGFDIIKANPVDSPLINNYSSIYTKVIKYDDVKVKSENNPDEGFDTLEQAQAELIRRAREQFSVFNVDKIQAEYTLNFIDLSRTEQYKDFQIAESVNIGDIVNIQEDVYNTNIKARVIKRVYSPKLKRRIETKISNISQDYKTISVESILKELEKQLETSKNPNLADYINTMIEAGLKDSYVVLKPNELLIMDNKDITKAKNVTRYNKNGLGFSTTGYYGNYEYGFTIDGKINASLISTGILSTVLIQNADGSVQLDLSKGNGINFFENGHKALAIENNSIKFYDWETNLRKEPVGQIYSSRRGGIASKPGIALGHNKDTYLAIGYQTNDTAYTPYVDFDKFFITKYKQFPFEKNTRSEVKLKTKPITFYEGINFEEYCDFNARPSMRYGAWLGEDNEAAIDYDKNTERIRFFAPFGFAVFMTSQGESQQIFRVKEDSAGFTDSSGTYYAHFSNTGFDIADKLFTNQANGITSRLDFHVMGNLTVGGSYPRNLSEKLDDKGIDLLHELYKKDLQIEELQERVSKLESTMNKMVKLIERGV